MLPLSRVGLTVPPSRPAQPFFKALLKAAPADFALTPTTTYEATEEALAAAAAGEGAEPDAATRLNSLLPTYK